MADAHDARPEYLDFQIEIGRGRGRQYPVSVVSSPAGEASETMRFPFDTIALDSHLKDLQIALLRSATHSRRIAAPEADPVERFGRALTDALLTGSVRSVFDSSLFQAKQTGKRLRLRLRIEDPQLAALPWEFLYDPRLGEYTCLTRGVALVRYIGLMEPQHPLVVTPPLRVLAMVASPSDLPALDVTNERQRIDTALARLQQAGLMQVTWLQGSTWRDLQRAMRDGPWHIFHFSGHGGFAAHADEGVLVMADDDGKTQYMLASQVGRLLADHPSLRLVVLNSCQGAEGSQRDLFSSTAATLVRRGIPAVIAMQYEITDDAAIEFSRGLYEALADGLPVDAAVAEARIGVSLALKSTLEWGTPVLSMRSADGELFRLSRQPDAPAASPPSSDAGLTLSNGTATLPAVPEVADSGRSAVDSPRDPARGSATTTPALAPVVAGDAQAPPVAPSDAASHPLAAGHPANDKTRNRRLLITTGGLVAIAIAVVAFFTAQSGGGNARNGARSPSQVAAGLAAPATVAPGGSVVEPSPKPSIASTVPRTATPGAPATATPASTSLQGIVLGEVQFPPSTAASAVDLLPKSTDHPEVSAAAKAGVYALVGSDLPVGVYDVTFPGSYQDTVLIIDIRLMANAPSSGVSVRCRATPGDQTGYGLRIHTDGSLQFFRVDHNQLATIPDALDPAQASPAKTDGSINHVELACVGSLIAAAINGVQVLHVNDTTYTSGQMRLGLLGPGNIEAQFSNISIRRATPANP